MTVLRAMIATVPLPKWFTKPEVIEIVSGIIPYLERHLDRLDRLYSDSFLVDYTLLAMGTIVQDDRGALDYEEWVKTRKLVLPPPLSSSNQKKTLELQELNKLNEDVMTVGESESDSSSESGSSSSSSCSDESDEDMEEG